MNSAKLYFFGREISIGNTLEISAIFSVEIPILTQKKAKIATISSFVSAEISGVLPIEISQPKNTKSELSLEKKIRSKEAFYRILRSQTAPVGSIFTIFRICTGFQNTDLRGGMTFHFAPTLMICRTSKSSRSVIE